MRKAVPGYEGCYEADDSGNIYSLDRYIFDCNGLKKRSAGRMLRPQLNGFGYTHLSLVNALGYKKRFRVHRLVMATFSPVDGMDSLEVNHKNGIKNDNRLCNLEWCTRSENTLHAFNYLGRKKTWQGKSGSLHCRSIAVVGLSKETGEEVVRFDALSSAQRSGYHSGHISSCLSGRLRSHKGLVWRAV